MSSTAKSSDMDVEMTPVSPEFRPAASTNTNTNSNRVKVRFYSKMPHNMHTLDTLQIPDTAVPKNQNQSQSHSQSELKRFFASLERDMSSKSPLVQGPESLTTSWNVKKSGFAYDAISTGTVNQQQGTNTSHSQSQSQSSMTTSVSNSNSTVSSTVSKTQTVTSGSTPVLSRPQQFVFSFNRQTQEFNVFPVNSTFRFSKRTKQERSFDDVMIKFKKNEVKFVNDREQWNRRCINPNSVLAGGIGLKSADDYVTQTLNNPSSMEGIVKSATVRPFLKTGCEELDDESKLLHEFEDVEQRYKKKYIDEDLDFKKKRKLHLEDKLLSRKMENDVPDSAINTNFIKRDDDADFDWDAEESDRFSDDDGNDNRDGGDQNMDTRDNLMERDNRAPPSSMQDLDEGEKEKKYNSYGENVLEKGEQFASLKKTLNKVNNGKIMGDEEMKSMELWQERKKKMEEEEMIRKRNKNNNRNGSNNKDSNNTANTGGGPGANTNVPNTNMLTEELEELRLLAMASEGKSENVDASKKATIQNQNQNNNKPQSSSESNSNSPEQMIDSLYLNKPPGFMISFQQIAKELGIRDSSDVRWKRCQLHLRRNYNYTKSNRGEIVFMKRTQ